jgi:hypothetical protein
VRPNFAIAFGLRGRPRFRARHAHPKTQSSWPVSRFVRTNRIKLGQLPGTHPLSHK